MWCRCMRRTVRFHYGSAFAKLPLDRKLVYVMEIDLHFLSSKLLMWIMLYEIVEKILKLRVYKTSCYSSVWEPHGSFSPQLYELWCEAGEKGDAYRSQALSVCSYLKCVWMCQSSQHVRACILWTPTFLSVWKACCSIMI